MSKTKNLWGGRFTAKANEEFVRFNRSFDVDKRLFEADIRASLAHAAALERAGVLSKRETAQILKSLRTLLKRSATEPAFLADESAEDIHSFIETRLVEIVGDTGKKLHTGRSRNDQVATAFRLWLRDEIDRILERVSRLQAELAGSARSGTNAVLPGYTHLQRAQPILWAHWCLAYFEMFERDLARLSDARRRVNILPLGSGALAGSGFGMDRNAMAKELGFEGVTANSLDAVSDRDFAIEFVAACSLIMVHLSRLAEDLIIYASGEFGFIELSDAVSSGSSLMPQKKNPDSLELIRGKAGRVFGRHTALLSMMKGLPLAYNKDMQEDKEAVFDSADTTADSLTIAAVVIGNIKINRSRMREAAVTGYLNATELADYLVRKGIPFREAHDIVGRAVLAGLDSGKELHELSLDQLRQFSREIGEDVFEALSLEAALSAKAAEGGTSPARVAKELKKASARLARRKIK